MLGDKNKDEKESEIKSHVNGSSDHELSRI